MYVLHRGAEDDLLEAAQFYRDEGGANLANRFLDEFERLLALLTEFLNIDRPAGDSRRVHPLQNFPYSVIYRETAGTIRILVVRAHLRDPRHGERRR